MSDISATITGANETIKALGKLGDAGLRAARRGVARAMRDVVKTAKSNTPVRTGALKKSLKIKTRLYKKRGVLVAIAGPESKYKQVAPANVKTKSGFIRPAYYAHLVESGGRRLKSHHMLSRALETKGKPGQVIDEIATEIKKEINKLEVVR